MKGESREEGGVEGGEGRVGRKEEWREERREEGREEGVEGGERRGRGGRRGDGVRELLINTW